MTTDKKAAAVYARYSIDKQNDKSIDDQITLCRQLAERSGWTIKDEFIFTDRAKSSASMFDRDGLLAMMALAKKRDYAAVICEHLDRLSRDPEDMPGIYKRLTFENIVIITPKGVTTDVDIGVHGLTGPLFLKELSNKVRRHHDGRAKEGLIPGAIAYGYRKLVGGRKGEREIDPVTSKVVIRIFQEYASGKSCRDIALGLNRDDIKSPSGGTHWNHQTFTHGRGDSRGMIGNRLYIGNVIWDDYTTIKNPDTGKRVRRKNKPEDVIITDAPHLRIVGQDLWDRANALNQRRAERMFGKGGKRPAKSVRTTDSLIAGLLTCADCGGQMIISKSKQERSTSTGSIGPRIACGNATSRATCEHRKSYDLKTLEREVLAGLKKYLTSPEKVIEYTKAYHARWTARQKDARDELAKEQKALNRTTIMIDRIVTAITMSNDPIPALMDKMKTLGVEKGRLDQKIQMIKSECSVITLHPQAIKTFSDNIMKMHTALSNDKLSADEAAPFRAAFRNFFDRIIVHATAPRKPYEVTPHVRLAAFMGLKLLPTIRSNAEMLAEQGYIAVPNNAGKGERDPRASNRCRPS